MDLKSNWRHVGIGEAASNKKRGENTVAVWLKEQFPNVGDEIRDVSNNIQTSGVRHDGTKYSSNVTQRFTVTATWLGDNNQWTSPDVRRGEQLFIYQVADAGTYYWLPISTAADLALRRLETVVKYISANPKNSDATQSRDNCYVLEVSAHDKHITLTTSAANAEKNTYLFQFDLENGLVQLTDDQNNSFFLNSMNHQFRFQNQEGTYTEIVKDIINVYAPTSINYQTKTFNLTATDVNITASDEIKMSASHSEVQGPVDFKSIIACPSIAMGSSASTSSGTGGSTAKLSGDVTHVNGIFKSPQAAIDTLNSTTIVVNSISWSSQSGPIA